MLLQCQETMPEHSSNQSKASFKTYQMKQLIYGGIIGLLALLSVTACEKEHQTISTSTQDNVTTDGKMLIFQSVEHYENTVSDLDEEKQQAFLNKIADLKYDNYFSTPRPAPSSNQSTVLEMDNFLGQLLNKDGVVQIGNHIYKVDLERDQVFVLGAEHKATADYNDLLKGNTENKNVQAYSAGDDVLALVNGSAAEKCGGIGGGTYPCYNNAYEGQIAVTLGDGSVWRLNPGVKFFRAGIFFRLSSLYDIWAYPNSQATSGGQKVNNISGLFTVEIFCRFPQGWYKKRPCDGSSIGTQSGGFYYSSTQASYQQTFYSGSRNLNGYYFYVQGRVKYPNGSVTLASPYGGRNINSPY